ncbi:hypothetical protein GGTG_14006 [Gaeumannomyces tritici R3-111a-1]|uniref:Uncharacterized protein n=1 Tax=Gaeumannomyces tritici (strain R3-111a-1) TaxID=644352 RepID=J3PKF2_GAET3|nr:hypothetical protein GGTG_14006 [Gaeumannomyces tritici R3-111a-1]EJT68417.1 hypothetical protein GGTG_14006 [Gaeumannomyces tritici R3-111a-1]
MLTVPDLQRMLEENEERAQCASDFSIPVLFLFPTLALSSAPWFQGLVTLGHGMLDSHSCRGREGQCRTAICGLFDISSWHTHRSCPHGPVSSPAWAPVVSAVQRTGGHGLFGCGRTVRVSQPPDLGWPSSASPLVEDQIDTPVDEDGPLDVTDDGSAPLLLGRTPPESGRPAPPGMGVCVCVTMCRMLYAHTIPTGRTGLDRPFKAVPINGSEGLKRDLSPYPPPSETSKISVWATWEETRVPKMDWSGRLGWSAWVGLPGYMSLAGPWPADAQNVEREHDTSPLSSLVLGGALHGGSGSGTCRAARADCQPRDRTSIDRVHVHRPCVCGANTPGLLFAGESAMQPELSIMLRGHG